MPNPAYGILLFLGIAVSAVLWSRVARPAPAMVMVYVGGLLGALVGAKLAYLALEWPLRWRDPDVWRQALYGRTILGGLLGGYAGVELGKKLIGHRAPTGDAFAIVVPVGLALGRVGCFLQGCCQGVRCPDDAWFAVRGLDGYMHYPAQLVECGFNLVMAALLGWLYTRRASRATVDSSSSGFRGSPAVRGFPALRGQLFHLYLIAYGLFRYGHEFLRDTPRPWGPYLTPYQLLALAVAAFGALRFLQRRRSNLVPPHTPVMDGPRPDFQRESHRPPAAPLGPAPDH